MFIRFVALIVCLAGVVSCTIVVYDLPGWDNMQSDMRIVICIIGGISFFFLTLLVLGTGKRATSADVRMMHHDKFN
jgi:hypothetical protein